MSDDNFIGNFIIANNGNECPKEYIVWSGYAALSFAIGPQVWINYEHFAVSANLYVCLVGPAGNRKTFARDKAMELLMDGMRDPVVSAECETKQGITAFMAQNEQTRFFPHPNGKLFEFHPYGIFGSELMNYLSLGASDMIVFLTDIYDHAFKPYRYRLKKEFEFIKNPYVVMLSCTTPKWLCDQIKTDQFCTGFGRRTIFVCNDSDIRMRPTMSEESRLARQRCVDRIKHVVYTKNPLNPGVVGEYRLDPEADHWFWKEWYLRFPLGDDPFMRSWRRSKSIQVLKVAMLTSLAEADTLVLTTRHLKTALTLLDAVESEMPMLTLRMGKSEVVESSLRIIEVLRNHGGIMAEKDLKAATLRDFKDPYQQYTTLRYLAETEQIVGVKRTVNGVERVCCALPEILEKKT